LSRLFSASTSRSRLVAGLHAAELGTPLVKRSRAESLSAAQVRHVHAGVGLLDKPDDLLVCESALAHCASSRLRGFFSIALVRMAGCRSGPTTSRWSMCGSLDRYPAFLQRDTSQRDAGLSTGQAKASLPPPEVKQAIASACKQDIRQTCGLTSFASLTRRTIWLRRDLRCVGRIADG
jgi:hypothetical protein